jgi:tRNA pseudouridine55 synthase
MRGILKNRYGFRKIKVGHAGTLDPLATGLLLICAGKFTKKIPEFQGQQKRYTGTFEMGATTPSFDRETEIDQRFPTDHLNPEILKNAAEKLTGEIEQRPPIFSALKKDGKRLYDYARKGEEVEIKTRKVQVDSFDITKTDLPEVHFDIRCGKGTYIRSMANDFGKLADSGAHLKSLRRTEIGEYSVDDALDIEGFEKLLPPKKE